jgi:filamentous hemagglutinin family protein
MHTNKAGINDSAGGDDMKRHASMNRIYRLVWNQALSAWIAVAEHATGRGKGGRRRLAAALALALSANLAQAAPSGGQVTAGSGSISQSGTTTTINQASQNLSLSWQSFNTAAQETVNFVQPSASAIAVNRIYDTNGTQFLGHLNANGQVWLINPNGVVFGQGAQVNVGGLVASTLDIGDASLNSTTRSFSGSGTGSVINQGNISAGYVALLGNTVSNQGNITANQGAVALGAGSAVTLTFADNKLVQMQVDRNTLNNLAENGGLIQADGGMVLLSAGAKDALLASVVNNTGVIEARSMQNVDGTIVLDGGNLGMASNSGTLDASGKNAGETGGTVKVLGGQVALATGTNIDVSGDAGGGTALIGGNFHGAGPEQNAATTDMAAGTTINADAISSGNGGNVAIWSDVHTSVDGTLSARGGANSGNGGQIETSGKQLTIGNDTRVGTLAPMGSAGDWLLDPVDFTIYGFGIDGPGDMADTTLNTALNSGSVTIQTGSGMTCTGVACGPGTSGNGDIILTDYAFVNWTAATTLTLSAYRDVTLISNVAGATIDASNNNTTYGNIVLRADNTGTGTGTVNIGNTAGLYTSAGSSTSIYYNPATWTDPIPTNYKTDGGAYRAGTFNVYQLVRVNNTSPAVTKTYDGTTTIASAPTFSLVVGTPTGASLTTGTASFANKNVGVSKTINYSGYSASGTNTDTNGFTYGYSLAAQPTATGTITTAPLTITANALSKTYGAADPTLTYTATGFVGGDTTASMSGALSRAAGETVAGGPYAISQGTLANSNYSISYTGANFTINAAPLTVTANALSKTYGATDPTLTYSYSGLVGGDTSAVFSGALSRAAGETVAGGPYAIGQNTLSAGSNYNISYTGANFTINAAPLTVTANALSKTYSASDPTLTYTYSGLVGSDTAAVFSGALSRAAGETVAGGPYAIGQNTLSAGSNYSISYTGANFTINPAPLTVTASNASKTYGQTPTLTAFTSSGLLNGETIGSVTETSSGAAAAASVAGGPYAITPSAATGGTFTASNYSINYVDGSLTVNPAPLTVTASNASKTYGQTPTLTAFTSSGLMNGETIGSVTETSAGTAATASVAGGPYTITPSSATGGTFSAGNYSITYANGSLTVNPADLTLSGTRVYDGTTTVAGSVLTALGANGETFTVTGTGDVSNLASKNVQTGSTLASITGLSLGTSSNGGLAGNYNALSTTGSSVTVTPKALTLGGITASNKVYDGGTSATLNTTSVTFSGLVSGDSISLGGAGVGNFADKNVANGKTVTVSGYTLGGTDAGNYSVGQPTGLTANITPASITVSGITASNKTYDGTTAATVNTAGAVFTGKVGGDAVTVSTTGTFADKNVANGKTVTLSSSYGGVDAGNYTFTDQASTTANITPKAVTLTAPSVSKTYDGGLTYTATAGNLTTLSGALVGSDTVTAATIAYTDKNVGTNKTVNLSAATINDGNGGNNYSVTLAGNTTSTITPAPLTVTANNDSRTYDGLAYSGGNGISYGGLAGGDTAAGVLSGTLAYGGTSQGAIDVGSYTIVPSGLASNSNYTLSFVDGVLTINAVQVATPTPPAVVTSTSTAMQSMFAQPQPTISQGSLDYVYTGSDSGAAANPPSGGGEGQASPPSGGNANPPAVNTTIQFGGVSTLVIVDSGILLPENMLTTQQ